MVLQEKDMEGGYGIHDWNYGRYIDYSMEEYLEEEQGEMSGTKEADTTRLGGRLYFKSLPLKCGSYGRGQENGKLACKTTQVKLTVAVLYSIYDSSLYNLGS